MRKLAAHAQTPRELRFWTLVFCFAALFLNGTWTAVWALGPLYSLPFFAALVVATFAPGTLRTEHWRLPPAPPAPVDWRFVAAATAPIVLLFALTMGQEFPFSGDHAYHFAGAKRIALQWGPRPGWLAPFALLALAWYRGSAGYAAAACALLVVAGAWLGIDRGGSRYPMGFYVLAQPALWIAALRHVGSSLNALRVTNVAAAIVWMGLLRPWLFGARAGWSLVLFSAAFFFQKDFAYYFASPYLEPWSFVLQLIALEYVVKRPPGWRFGAMASAGLACGFKEQAACTPPWIWLAAYGLDAIRKPALRTEAIVVGALSVLPVWLYLGVRDTMQAHRGFQLAPWSVWVSSARFGTYGERLYGQFGVGGLTILALTLVLFVVLLVRRSTRRNALLLGGLIAGHVAIFHGDKVAVFWTGYSRFLLIPIGFLCFPWLLVGEVAEARGHRRWVIAGALFFAALQLPELVPAFRLAARPAPERSFTEHVDAPLYLPIHELFRRVEADPRFRALHRIRESAPPGAVLAHAYRREFAPFSDEAEIGRTPCTCDGQTVFLITEPVPGGWLRNRPLPDSLAALHAFNAGCLPQLQASCGRVEIDRVGSQLAGALAY